MRRARDVDRRRAEASCRIKQAPAHGPVESRDGVRNGVELCSRYTRLSAIAPSSVGSGICSNVLPAGPLAPRLSREERMGAGFCWSCIGDVPVNSQHTPIMVSRLAVHLPTRVWIRGMPRRSAEHKSQAIVRLPDRTRTEHPSFRFARLVSIVLGLRRRQFHENSCSRVFGTEGSRGCVHRSGAHRCSTGRHQPDCRQRRQPA